MKIIYENKDSGLSVIIPAGKIEDCIKDVPEGLTYEIVEDSEIPEDRIFRGAWEKNGKKVTVDLSKSKEIAHDKRREARAKEFAPLDIKATILSEAEGAEAQRAVIRSKYEKIQNNIDNTSDIKVLKNVVVNMGD